MAPKRKAPVSSSSSSKPKPKGGPKPKPEGYWPKKNKQPAVKKARVEVEYEDSASSLKKGGKTGLSGSKKAPQPIQPKSVAPVSASKPKKGGKKLTFAADVPYKSPFADESEIAQDDDDEPVESAKSTGYKTKKPKAPLPTGPRTFQIVAGSYEKLLYGLSGLLPEPTAEGGQQAEHDYTMKPVFIFPAHQACIKTVAASEGGKWLATGSSDEMVKIWDLRRRKEVGGLMNHNGTITSLYFPSRSHLLTTSEDSTLSLFRTRDWTLLRSFKGHVGRVNSVTVHPSGKLALTVGKDRVLRMWDLMKGKPGGGVKIGKEGEIVRFAPSGDQFAILSITTLDIYTKEMKLVQTIENPKRFHDFQFLDVKQGETTRELLVAAAEEGYVRVYERFESKEPKQSKAVEIEDEEDEEDQWKEVARLGGHTNRVKSLAVLFPLLSTVSSDGFVNLYNLSNLPNLPAITGSDVPVILPVGKYDTNGTRLTCLTMAEGVRLSTGGEEGEVVDSDSESEGGEELEGDEEEEDEEEDEEDEEEEEEDEEEMEEE